MKTLIAIALLAAAFPASARQVDNCRAIKDNDQRLACFDRTAGEVAADECEATQPGKFSADCINEKLQKQKP